ncbi:MAG: ABC transporter substrate-binding protein [Gammaproteobacteria bacterium]|jgi:phospholipid transport system substrate-binding protein|nr:ABC transporter substrate-binding protein [Gammaproteobacteria bacterium]MDP6974569.1 ABC transporter substrate-binding protein [Gammaproteobacteria bacterium]
MKILLDILKVILINISFIGLTFAANPCPSISPNDVDDTPVAQSQAIIDDILCSFIELNKNGSSTFFTTLNIAKKKIIPYIDVEYSTELALSDYWDQLQFKDRKIFERDLRNSLINEYIDILASIVNWNRINIIVDENFEKKGNLAKIKVTSSLDNEPAKAIVTLKMIRKDRWRVYDLIYQSISMVDIEKYSYRSKINRYGMEEFIQVMLEGS